MKETAGETRGGNFCWIAVTFLLALAILTACVMTDDRPEITSRIAGEIAAESGLDPHCNCAACEYIKLKESRR